MADVRAHVAQVERALELAREPALEEWSVRTAERALAWARCVEDDAEREGLAVVKAALRDVTLGKRKRGQVPVRADKNNDPAWVLHARKTLLVTMAESAYLSPKLQRWVKEQANGLASSTSAEVAKALERCSTAREQLESLGSGRDDALHRVEGSILLDELVGSAAFRIAWNELEDSTSLQKLALAAQESFYRAENFAKESHQGNAEAQRKNEDAQTWLLERLRKGVATLWKATRREVVLDLAKRDFALAAGLLSHIIIQAQVSYSIMGTIDAVSAGFRQFCETAPWMRILCEDALQSSTATFALSLRQVISRP
ncbi:Hypothetical Protein FCC1311_103102 [Hondaea fermentalgiana]|uniref:Uncharacterized protein n=1 Tax=Hondaea fermentalgiana TaxID=2315210 RepID=A0A2R5GT90_9STRA|nr:Hypothetical Protein FCC1311_103102 [Hondaea fermentalgiana]|eukprot:GBG34087.1 Hypothetical Protein FCC1311_103102 [Hondaea fermentalgiana]